MLEPGPGSNLNDSKAVQEAEETWKQGKQRKAVLARGKNGCLSFFILLDTSKMSAAYLESIAELGASANAGERGKSSGDFGFNRLMEICFIEHPNPKAHLKNPNNGLG